MRTMEQLAAALYPSMAGDRKAAAVLQHPTLSDAELELQAALEPPEAPPKPRRPAAVLGGISDKVMKAVEEDIRAMEAELAQLERWGE